MKNSLIFAFAMLVAGIGGYSMQTWLHTDTTANASISAAQPGPEFAMLDLAGKTRNSKEWQGKVVLLNFWATWCPPCLEEIPSLIELQDSYGALGLQIVGVAVDDTQAVRAFAAGMGFNYPILPGDTDAIELSKRYGNQQGVLPYSVFINREGEIIQVIRGELKKDHAEKILAQLGIGN
jgi:thiol-disulfide isomerase/thioredoxin